MNGSSGTGSPGGGAAPRPHGQAPPSRQQQQQQRQQQPQGQEEQGGFKSRARAADELAQLQQMRQAVEREEALLVGGCGGRLWCGGG